MDLAYMYTLNGITWTWDNIKPQDPDEALLETTVVALPTAKDYEREIKKMMFPDQFADNVEDSKVAAFEL
ncbi:hypothetical protein T069G_07187 [Trichoderma breve]|uniref:Uncharacterized protein n=1 Tax=Trichoderma breve TaxID=2034170 RepID=A0A9W9E668_9HYPO|nr:hypothetical protein T069G_07187 [Trichoderma breve]KAJ4858920.1 hypothetical protein T069G_07187 [Trichoderma breve]